ASPLGAGNVVRDLTDAIGVGDRRPSELLHDHAHGPERYRSTPPTPQPVTCRSPEGPPSRSLERIGVLGDLGTVDHDAPGAQLGDPGGDVATHEGAQRLEVVAAQ